MMTLRDRRQYLDMIQVYKIINDLDCLDVNEFFKFVKTNYTTRSSTQNKLEVSKSRLKARSCFFTIRVIAPWNNIPQEIRSLPTLNQFKNRLKLTFDYV